MVTLIKLTLKLGQVANEMYVARYPRILHIANIESDLFSVNRERTNNRIVSNDY